MKRNEKAKKVIGVILTLVVPAGQTLLVTKLKVATNVAAVIAIGFDTAFPPTNDLDFLFLPGAMTFAETVDGAAPLLKVINTTALPLNVYVYAPNTAMGVTPNDSIGHIFYATIGGVIE